MSLRFAGRRALVTGAAGGIGEAVAGRMAAEGAHVIVADLDTSGADRVAADIRRAGGSAEGLALDVADSRSFIQVGDRVGELDIVVANAGIQTFASVLDVSVEEWDRVLAVNARGALLTMQFAARHLADGGSIVAMASIQARLPNPYSANYAASKAAVLSTVKSFASALAPRQVRVNAVAPGRIETGLSDSANERLGQLTGQKSAEMLELRRSANPLGRFGRVGEVAAVVAFLASDDASYITGECINVCGGDVML